jgi:DNA-binding GntR family transcriptional regulator
VRTWTAQDLEESYELRAVLEGLAARRAAARVEPAVLAVLAEMDDLAERMVAVDPSLGHRPAGDFDELALARSHAHHREIVDALRAGDGAWAESVMRSHVLAARAVLLTSYRALGEAS